MLNHIPLDKATKARCFSIMTNVAKTLKQWSVFTDISMSKLRKLIFDSQDKLAYQCWSPEWRDACQTILSLKTECDWLDNRSIEESVVSAYLPLIKRLAKRWKALDPNNDNLPDYTSNGCLAMINCLYYWDGRTSFMTYAHNSLENKLNTDGNKDNLYCPFNLKDRKMLAAYTKVKQQSPFMTHDEIVDSLQLTPKQRLILSRMTYKIINDRDIFSDKNDDSSHDYTELRVDLSKSDNQQDELQELINSVKLTPVQQEVLEFCRNYSDQRGWVKALAARPLVNGKKYTEAGISLIYKKLIEKLRFAHDHAESQEVA